MISFRYKIVIYGAYQRIIHQNIIFTIFWVGMISYT